MRIVRLIAVNIAMWTLGMVSLGLFALAVVWLDGQPLQATDGLAVTEPSPDDGALATLTAGTARSAATAQQHLQVGERSAAVHAIDATHRAAEIGHAVGHGEVKDAFTVARDAIVKAREALHNGAPEATLGHLEDAVTHLEDAVEPARQMRARVPPEPVWGGYEGAVLINANGIRLGEVEHLAGSSDDPSAVIRTGGATDVAGVFDVGGRTVEVPADGLLWGPRRSIGASYVAVPTEATSLAGEG